MKPRKETQAVLTVLSGPTVIVDPTTGSIVMECTCHLTDNEDSGPHWSLNLSSIDDREKDEAIFTLLPYEVYADE